jgi:hypothetical protein
MHIDGEVDELIHHCIIMPIADGIGSVSTGSPRALPRSLDRGHFNYLSTHNRVEILCPPIEVSGIIPFNKQMPQVVRTAHML